MTLQNGFRAACAVIAALAFTSAAEAGHCKRVGGQGTAITNLLATDNAKLSLADAIAASGGKARGKVAVSCKYDLVVSTCTASQRVCK